jgi:DNA polymerase-3 subunit epsilon
MKYLFFDIETTGLSTEKAQIIEVAFVARGEELKSGRTFRIRPTCPIEQGAIDTHGITEDDLAQEPTFLEALPRLLKIIEWADVLVGYNSTAFDWPILKRQLTEHGAPSALDGKHHLDAYAMWQALEPRTLVGAVARFAPDKDFEKEAHGALADTNATVNVFDAMVSLFGLEQSTPEEIDEISYPDKKTWVNDSHHFIWNEEDQVVVNFGKHAGKLLRDVVWDSYFKWVMGKDFPAGVTEVILAGRKQPKLTFDSGLAELFGHEIQSTEKLEAA